jgi:hypothetical protein
LRQTPIGTPVTEGFTSRSRSGNNRTGGSAQKAEGGRIAKPFSDDG